MGRLDSGHEKKTIIFSTSGELPTDVMLSLAALCVSVMGVIKQ